MASHSQIVPNYEKWLQFSAQMTREAGEIVNSLFGSPPELRFKEGLDGRPSTLTTADLKSEKHLVAQIERQFPDHGIFGEEGTDIKNDADYVWYLDPLDGTTNFWRNIPLYGISVGLTYQKKPVLGVLYFPSLKLMVSGYEGGGAFANDEQITVSQRTLDRSMYYVSCQEARSGLRFPLIEKKVGWVKAIDATSYELAQIAMGDAEIYTFFQKAPQDMVAGTVLVQEAGGMVTDESGSPWTTDSEIIVASNGIAHEEILKLIKIDLNDEQNRF